MSPILLISFHFFACSEIYRVSAVTGKYGNVTQKDTFTP